MIGEVMVIFWTINDTSGLLRVKNELMGALLQHRVWSVLEKKEGISPGGTLMIQKVSITSPIPVFQGLTDLTISILPHVVMTFHLLPRLPSPSSSPFENVITICCLWWLKTKWVSLVLFLFSSLMFLFFFNLDFVTSVSVCACLIILGVYNIFNLTFIHISCVLVLSFFILAFCSCECLCSLSFFILDLCSCESVFIIFLYSSFLFLCVFVHFLYSSFCFLCVIVLFLYSSFVFLWVSFCSLSFFILAFCFFFVRVPLFSFFILAFCFCESVFLLFLYSSFLFL